MRRSLFFALALGARLARADEPLHEPRAAQLPDLGMEVHREVPDAGPVVDAGPVLLADGGLAPLAPPDQAAILAAVQLQQPAITACVETEHSHHPGWLASRVSAGFTLSAKGTVSAVHLGDAKMNKTKLGQCLRAALAKVVLPPFDGEPMLIEVPLVLHSGGSGEPHDRSADAP